jgi:hypothetical protein
VKPPRGPPLLLQPSRPCLTTNRSRSVAPPRCAMVVSELSTDHVPRWSGAGPPAELPPGWDRQWSRTFSREYFWCAAREQSVWTLADCLAQASMDGTAENIPECDQDTTETHSATTETPSATTETPSATAEEGHYFDFGDDRVGFPRDKPAAAPYVHGWVYPPMTELLQRLCNPQTSIIIEVCTHPRAVRCAASRPTNGDLPACSWARGLATPRNCLHS